MCQNSIFLIFTFFIGLNLIQLKWQNQPVICFASICSAYGSTLLAYVAHTLANCQRRRHIRQQNRVKMSFCKRMLHMQLQIASVCGACGSTFLVYAAHAVATCQSRRCIRQQIASICAAYGSTLLAQTVHEVAKTKRYTLHDTYSLQWD